MITDGEISRPTLIPTSLAGIMQGRRLALVDVFLLLCLPMMVVSNDIPDRNCGLSQNGGNADGQIEGVNAGAVKSNSTNFSQIERDTTAQHATGKEGNGVGVRMTPGPFHNEGYFNQSVAKGYDYNYPGMFGHYPGYPHPHPYYNPYFQHLPQGPNQEHPAAYSMYQKPQPMYPPHPYYPGQPVSPIDPTHTGREIPRGQPEYHGYPSFVKGYPQHGPSPYHADPVSGQTNAHPVQPGQPFQQPVPPGQYGHPPMYTAQPTFSQSAQRIHPQQYHYQAVNPGQTYQGSLTSIPQTGQYIQQEQNFRPFRQGRPQFTSNIPVNKAQIQYEKMHNTDLESFEDFEFIANRKKGFDLISNKKQQERTLSPFVKGFIKDLKKKNVTRINLTDTQIIAEINDLETEKLLLHSRHKGMIQDIQVKIKGLREQMKDVHKAPVELLSNIMGSKAVFDVWKRKYPVAFESLVDQYSGRFRNSMARDIKRLSIKATTERTWSDRMKYRLDREREWHTRREEIRRQRKNWRRDDPSLLDENERARFENIKGRRANRRFWGEDRYRRMVWKGEGRAEDGGPRGRRTFAEAEKERYNKESSKDKYRSKDKHRSKDKYRSKDVDYADKGRFARRHWKEKKKPKDYEDDLSPIDYPKKYSRESQYFSIQSDSGKVTSESVDGGQQFTSDEKPLFLEAYKKYTGKLAKGKEDDYFAKRAKKIRDKNLDLLNKQLSAKPSINRIIQAQEMEKRKKKKEKKLVKDKDKKNRKKQKDVKNEKSENKKKDKISLENRSDKENSKNKE